MFHGENSSKFLSCLQHFACLRGVIILPDENTNKLTELIASAINNIADLFIGINRCFLGETKIKVKCYSNK
jgi:hypothetical protein